MVKKFLVIGNHLQYATSLQDLGEETIKVVEMDLPLEVYQDSKELLKAYNYLKSFETDPTKIRQKGNDFFSLVAPYACNEKDRNWLYERISKKK